MAASKEQFTDQRERDAINSAQGADSAEHDRKTLGWKVRTKIVPVGLQDKYVQHAKRRAGK